MGALRVDPGLPSSPLVGRAIPGHSQTSLNQFLQNRAGPLGLMFWARALRRCFLRPGSAQSPSCSLLATPSSHKKGVSEPEGNIRTGLAT